MESTIWSDYWNGISPLFVILRYTPTYRKVISNFSRIDLARNAKIIDVGCGTGKLASYWLNEGYDVTGIDISDVALNNTTMKGVKTLKADVLTGLPFSDGSFDLVYTDGLIEHFIDPEPVLKELFRISGRYLFTIVPRISYLKTAIDLIIPPPKEYKKTDEEWIDIHRRFKPKSIKKIDLFTCLGIQCEIK